MTSPGLIARDAAAQSDGPCAPLSSSIADGAARRDPLSRPRVLVFTTLYPNPSQPGLGVFVHNRVVATAAHCPTTVVAPVLWRPDRWHLERERKVPAREQRGTLTVHHPRFTTIPALARAADAFLLFAQTLAYVGRLHRRNNFDLIDANYAYPDGTAALLLARTLGLPVALTVRGGDIDLLPRYRLRRRAIQWTLRRVDRVIAVSQHLAAGAVALGAPSERLTVIENGIAPDTFSFVARQTARQRLGLTGDGALVLSVGNLIADKGHHLVIEALARLAARRGEAPRLVILGASPNGNSDYPRRLAARAAALGLSDRVVLAGSREQHELRDWYCAADLLALATAREGCPNVVREALACGTPVVASRVGGVPELIPSSSFGALVAPGDIGALAAALDGVLSRAWDRPALAAACGRRTWGEVGRAVSAEFRALAAASPRRGRTK